MIQYKKAGVKFNKMGSSLLRKKYPEFIYESFSWEIVKNDLVVCFLFKVSPDIQFHPQISIKNIPLDRFKTLSKEAIDNFVFHLGLAEIPGYWKATCSPKIIIKAGFLTNDQIEWWKDLLINGMGQFYFENNIDFTDKDYIDIVCEQQNKKYQPAESDGDKILIPVGGGKDSAVTLEILTYNFNDCGAFIVRQSPQSKSLAQAAGIRNVIEVERTISPKLLELNSQGFLNGHTPYSSVLAFYSVFCAYLFGYKHLAFSNEGSSNEGNTEYLGKVVNHQYSKTFEFENKFRRYNQTYLSDVNYFSFVRPLHEVQIARIFSKIGGKYFRIFRSCNIGLKEGVWCGKCSKCLSTFILLYPFLGKDKTVEVFGRNLFADESLKEMLLDLTLDSRVKPFECVGTREELKLCLYLAIQDSSKRSNKLDVLLDFAKKEVGPLKGSVNRLLTGWEKENNLPKNFELILKQYLHD